jgi:hypothetical protein
MGPHSTLSLCIESHFPIWEAIILTLAPPDAKTIPLPLSYKRILVGVSRFSFSSPYMFLFLHCLSRRRSLLLTPL